MITTIQLNENVKRALDRFKTKKETYEQVIVNLMKSFENSKKERENLLIESCKAMADENLNITNTFERMEDLSKWRW